MRHRLGAALLLVGLTACGAGSGGGSGTDWSEPACGDRSYDPGQYKLTAEFNGNECAFVFFIESKGGDPACVCQQPGPTTYCGATIPAFDGKCPSP